MDDDSFEAVLLVPPLDGRDWAQTVEDALHAKKAALLERYEVSKEASQTADGAPHEAKNETHLEDAFERLGSQPGIHAGRLKNEKTEIAGFRDVPTFHALSVSSHSSNVRRLSAFVAQFSPAIPMRNPEWAQRLRRRKLLQGEALHCGVLILPSRPNGHAQGQVGCPSSEPEPQLPVLENVKIPQDSYRFVELPRWIFFARVVADLVTNTTLEGDAEAESSFRVTGGAGPTSVSVLSSQFLISQAFPVRTPAFYQCRAFRLPENAGVLFTLVFPLTIAVSYLERPLHLVVIVYEAPPDPCQKVSTPQTTLSQVREAIQALLIHQKRDPSGSVWLPSAKDAKAFDILGGLSGHAGGNLCRRGRSVSQAVTQLLQEVALTPEPLETNVPKTNPNSPNGEVATPISIRGEKRAGGVVLRFSASMVVSNPLSITSESANHSVVHIGITNSGSDYPIEIECCHLRNVTRKQNTSLQSVLKPLESVSFVFGLANLDLGKTTGPSFLTTNTMQSESPGPATAGLAVSGDLSDAQGGKGQPGCEKRSECGKCLADLEKSRGVLPLGVKWRVAGCPLSTSVWTQYRSEFQLPGGTPLELLLVATSPVEENGGLLFTSICLSLMNCSQDRFDIQFEFEAAPDAGVHLGNGESIGLTPLQRTYALGIVEPGKSAALDIPCCTTKRGLVQLPSMTMIETLTNRRYLVNGGKVLIQ